MTTSLQVVGQLPVQQKISAMLVIAVAVALGVGAWMWGTTPDYRVLHANLGERDGGAVIASLQQMNLPYKFVDGTLMVPAAQLHEARMRLAGQGLPRGGLAGFELMENQKLGASQFLEQVNYQRALEGELARSIQSVAAVQTARVHLALTKPSAFLREQPKTSASVLVNLHAGRTLDRMQVTAITHLVSNSVPGLPAGNVTIVDQTGTLLSGESEAGSKLALDSRQLKYRQDLEQSYAQRIEAILLPLFGPGNARAQVAADIDFTETEQADEIYKPNQKADVAAVRSQQSSENSTPGAQAGGVPGALTNQPPTPATAPVTAPGTPPVAAGATSAAAIAATRRESTVNYEVDRSIRHTRQAMGRVKKLSVAVVVNHNQITNAKGKITARPLSTAQKKQLNELVRGVIGYNEERGDTISVVNSPFKKPDAEVIPDVPAWKQPQNIELAKDTGKHLLIGALVLYLLLGIVRPMLRNLTTAPPMVMPELLTQNGPASSARPGAVSYDQSLQNAKQIATQDPKIVANVVKSWVGSNE